LRKGLNHLNIKSLFKRNIGKISIYYPYSFYQKRVNQNQDETTKQGKKKVCILYK
jgi:hypothetical protein